VTTVCRFTRRGVLAALGAGAVATGFLGRVGFQRSTARRVDALFADASTTDRTYEPAALDGLPTPVRRYLDSVLEEGQPYARTVRLTQRGQFRIGDASASWKPLAATQQFTVDPPGFVWDARIEMAPLLPVRVVDEFVGGAGALRARLLSTLPVADAGPGPETNAGELSRYLAETPWFPTALLPGEGVEWEPIDDGSARASLSHRGTSVSLVFHFEDDEVRRVTTDRRYRSVDGGFEPTPWTGYWWNYEERNGVRVPAEGEAEWHLPAGDLPYWRGTVTDLAYDPE
jgi:hypothetical protein